MSQTPPTQQPTRSPASPDLVEIGREHHRAGRLQRAEDLYRQALARDPNDAEALHWLGVLMHQAGRTDDAIDLLERAVAIKSDDAAYLHNLAHAYLSRGRFPQAVEIGRAHV